MSAHDPLFATHVSGTSSNVTSPTGSIDTEYGVSAFPSPPEGVPVFDAVGVDVSLDPGGVDVGVTVSVSVDAAGPVSGVSVG
jgi:hypothetical protein